MKNTMGRLAGAVLACALITLTVAPAASAQPTDVTPTSEVTETSAPSESPTPTPTSSSAPEPTSSEPPVVTTSSSPTTSKPPTDPTPTSTSKPTETTPTDPTDPTDPTEPPEEPYEDGLVYGIDFGDGEAIMVISCASGAPENVVSPDFDITAGPFQDEVDGRFWGYGLAMHSGAVVNGEDVRVSFSCGGKQYGDVPVPPAGGSGGGSAAPEKKSEEKAQVKYAPKGGVETGFGGIARG